MRQEDRVGGDFTWISSSEICCWSSAMAAMLSASRSLTAITSSLLCRGEERGWKWGEGVSRVATADAFLYFLYFFFLIRTEMWRGRTGSGATAEENRFLPPLLSVRAGLKVYHRAAAYLAFNLGLSPLDLLKLHVQVLVLRRQRLHAVLEASRLLLSPPQLVAVDLVLWERSQAVGTIRRRSRVYLIFFIFFKFFLNWNKKEQLYKTPQWKLFCKDDCCPLLVRVWHCIWRFRRQ